MCAPEELVSNEEIFAGQGEMILWRHDPSTAYGECLSLDARRERRLWEMLSGRTHRNVQFGSYS